MVKIKRQCYWPKVHSPAVSPPTATFGGPALLRNPVLPNGYALFSLPLR